MKTMIVFLVLISEIVGQDTVTVRTKLGNVIGISSSLKIYNKTYKCNVFKRIPYAKPPINNLRFSEPVPHGPWTGTLDATTFGSSCIQLPIMNTNLPNMNMSEDCLFLNIYVSTDNSVTKSVMVWVHGGAFQIGQGMGYPGSYLAVSGDVVIVTINYRLGVFGFLSTQDNLAPGNYGLWDQRLAVKWVHENIESFGGDPNMITVFGESSGGFGVGLMALSPSNMGLFKRVILQSGVGNSLLAISHVARLATEKLARASKCSENLTNETIKCLRSKKAIDIFQAYTVVIREQEQYQEFPFSIAFAPVVDGKFLLESPQNILNGSKNPSLDFYQSLDVVIGNCEGEGSLLLGSLIGRQYNVLGGIPSSYLCNHIIPSLALEFYNNNSRILQAICNKYKSEGPIQIESLNSLNFHGDAFFYSPTTLSLNVHSMTSVTNTFEYIVRRLTSDPNDFIPWFHEAGHGYETWYLFPWTPLTNASEDAQSFSQTMMKYWTNFAKTGDVNGPGLTVWPQYDHQRKHYAILDVNVTIEDHLYQERMDFWLKEIPRLLKLDSIQPPFG